MAFHRTTYTIGFMGWYDTFKNTKINYWLIPLGLAQGPLIYLYVRTIVETPFTWRRYDALHFIPVLVYIVYRFFLLAYDANQAGWSEGYEGQLMRSLHIPLVEPFYAYLVYTSKVLYLAFTVQLFYHYRRKIRQFFSNTYRVELNWIRNFLVLYILLFAYSSITNIIDAFITDLTYIHNWWFHLFSAIVLLYLGIKAYYTDIGRLHELTFDLDQASATSTHTELKPYDTSMLKIKQFMEKERPYLNPEFNLRNLAQALQWSIHETSETINQGFGKNFNEFTNDYRIENVKQLLVDPAYDHLSLVAIAFDSGFNSKATFNRVFKKTTGVSPSLFKQQAQTTA